ncbi:MAG: IS66 family transposase [Planctomycetes bacterium]|nr:IS66 family transposase [Planctomycetota bacterium]MCB9900965.1 IS66 family transposase [Planctomycetota bacterium]
MAQAIELPTTLEAAHALIAELSEHVAELRADNAKLKHELDQHARRLFGKKSEKLDAAQLELAYAALNAASADETDAADEIEVPAHKRKRKGHGRTRFSEDLPRERRVIEPDSTTCGCCGQAMAQIGEETSEQLDYMPATCRVIETVRPKYACGTCKDGVHVALAPQGPIPKGKATAATLAHVAVAKYVDHLPLVRQTTILRRAGVTLSKQTLGGWVRQVSDLVERIERAQWDSILASRVLRADETPVKVLVEGKKQAHRAYLWAYLGDRDEVAFDFSMGRKGEAPLAALATFTHGVLLADGYAGYNEVVSQRPDVSRAGCWAHARRYFFEAKKTASSRALPILALIRQLYAVESEIQEATTTPRQRAGLASVLRASKSRAILDEIKALLDRDVARVLPKSPIGKAIGYALGQWTELTRFAENGEIPIDNNATERALRAVAVGRNNWTFCGSEAGGAWAARLYGLLGTCRLQGKNPFAWLSDVLGRVRDHPPERMDELTPRLWTPATT